MKSEEIPYEDPEGWGFCKYCAFDVARDPETGKALSHERRNGAYDTVRCYGSLRKTGPMPDPPIAEPYSMEAKSDETIVKGDD